MSSKYNRLIQLQKWEFTTSQNHKTVSSLLRERGQVTHYAMLRYANAVIPHSSSCAAHIPPSSPSKHDYLPTASLSHTLPSAEFKLGGTAEFVTAATVMLMAGNNGRLGHVSISEGASWNIASDEDLNLLSIDFAVLMKMHTGPRGLS